MNVVRKNLDIGQSVYRSICGLRRLALRQFIAVSLLLVIAGTEPCRAADVIIYGATPGGVVTAVRSAREGLKVTLISTYPHVGGILTNGLGLFDTLYAGRRAPLYDEVHDRIMSHYPAGSWGFEPHVAEKVFEALLGAEPNIEVIRGYYPVSAGRHGRVLERVIFHSFSGQPEIALEAPAFVDASYEGDLASVSGVAMTVGRESREQYGEPHAGVIFTKVVETPKPNAYTVEKLNMHEHPIMTSAPMPGSTGAADDAVQAYNFRVTLTNNPSNRIPISKPARYERGLYRRLLFEGQSGISFPLPNLFELPYLIPLPNQKTDWNAPTPIEGSFSYPEGSWTLRREIVAQHRDFALGYLWYLQHDPEVPPQMRAKAISYGLPKDEFQANGGFPREVYVREARRMIGRYVFTEHDAKPASGMVRSPVHEDSIAITTWALDSYNCHWNTVSDSDFEGKVLLAEETRPGQIPFGVILPKEFDNLLVTGALSASHIGWGAIRVEPTLMHLGESAAHALVIAHGKGLRPALISVPELQRILVEHGIMITFFNDVRYINSLFHPEDAVAQHAGVRGLFPSYWSRQPSGPVE